MSFILEYGKPGSGKTTLAASMTKLGYKVLFIDIDNKIPQMVNLKPLLDKGLIKALPIKSRLTQTKMGDRLRDLHIAFSAPGKVPSMKKAPEGYLEYCDIITGFEEAMEKGDKSEYQVLVHDSFTTFQEHMKRYILYLQKQDKFSYDEWEIWKTNIEEFSDIHQRLQGYFKHVIIISHEMLEKDELIGKIEVLPMIDGSMKYKIGKNFDEVYHCKVEIGPDRKAKYQVVTIPFERAEARTSRNLEAFETADFLTLFKDEKEK